MAADVFHQNLTKFILTNILIADGKIYELWSRNYASFIKRTLEDYILILPS